MTRMGVKGAALLGRRRGDAFVVAVSVVAVVAAVVRCYCYCC